MGYLLCSNVGCQVVVYVSNGMMFGLIFLPSAMQLVRVQFSRHFSLLCTWMILSKCYPVKRCLYCVICRWHFINSPALLSVKLISYFNVLNVNWLSWTWRLMRTNRAFKLSFQFIIKFAKIRKYSFRNWSACQFIPSKNRIDSWSLSPELWFMYIETCDFWIRFLPSTTQKPQ